MLCYVISRMVSLLFVFCTSENPLEVQIFFCNFFSVLEVPGFVESVLQSSHAGEHGFDIRDAALMVTWWAHGPVNFYALVVDGKHFKTVSGLAVSPFHLAIQVSTLEQLIFDSESMLLEKAGTAVSLASW